MNQAPMVLLRLLGLEFFTLMVGMEGSGDMGGLCNARPDLPENALFFRIKDLSLLLDFLMVVLWVSMIVDHGLTLLIKQMVSHE